MINILRRIFRRTSRPTLEMTTQSMIDNTNRALGL